MNVSDSSSSIAFNENESIYLNTSRLMVASPCRSPVFLSSPPKSHTERRASSSTARHLYGRSNFPDNLLSRCLHHALLPLFEVLDGAEIAETLLGSLAIIEDLDVLECRLSDFLACWVEVLVDDFLLQYGEEAFTLRIVPRNPDSRETLLPSKTGPWSMTSFAVYWLPRPLWKITLACNR
jgi:hypothetical protein